MPTAEVLLERKTGHVHTVEKQNTVLEAARKMNQHRIGAVIVVNGPQVLGIFTERDVLTRVVAAGRDPGATLVEEVMTTPMACCTRNTKIAEIKAVMTEKKIRHLPVVEGGHLFGIISIGDLMAAEVDNQASTIEYLSEYLYGRT